MRFYTVEINNKQFPSIQGNDGRVYPLNSLNLNFEDMNDLISNISYSELAQLKNLISSDQIIKFNSYSLNEVKLCAPIPIPKQDILCLGVNYNEHILETKELEDFQNNKATVYFSKHVNFATGSGEYIPNYDFVDSLDYEVELGVIIGKDIKNYKKSDGTDGIFGYTIINDVSARNIQFRHGQWFLGKSLDGYTPMGPCIVTPDEIPDIQNLNITCKVNGELRQSSNTKFMIQPVFDALEELSQGLTLKAGTIISTGTPGGVGMGMNPPQYLKSGDIVECEIEKIGSLINIVE